MPTKVKIRSHYNLNEHAYVFASFVYAFLIVSYFENDVVKKFLSLMPKLFYPSEWEIDLNLTVVFYFFLFIFFLVFIIESWWGSRLEQTSLGSFKSYVFFLSHPFFLFLFERIVFDPNQFKMDSLSNPNLTIILRFFFMSALILGNLIVIRSYFIFIENPSKKWNGINNKWEKVKFIFQFIKEYNGDRIRAFCMSLILSLLLYNLELPPNFLVILSFVVMILAVVTLFHHIQENEKKFNKQNHKAFLNELAEYYLPSILRGKKSYGFLLLNVKKIPKSIIECVIQQIREDDLYTTDDSQICCCFITSDGNIEEFELWIKAWAIEADAEHFIDNHDIAFSYYKFRRTHFAKDYYKLEFFKIFNKAYDQLNASSQEARSS